jgi:DNA (cytosine-5)-methyltransferase 1
MKPRLLDLFACEGGASVGYQRAGFEVFAVDLDANRLARNPHAYAARGVFEFLAELGAWIVADEFDAIHASPPCQGYTRGNAGKVTAWPKLIPGVREALDATGLPYVIENVTDAAPEMVNPVALCGCMFDLSTIDDDGIRIHLKRERMFETGGGFTLTAPRPCNHDGVEWWAGAYGGARRDKYEAKYVRKGGYVPPNKDVVKALLGVEHDMTWNGLFECIPPAYAQHVGTQLLAHINQEKAA